MLNDLIKLLQQCNLQSLEDTANYMISHGVVKPPVQVDDTVYVISPKVPCYACYGCSDWCHLDCMITDRNKPVVRQGVVRSIVIGQNGMSFTIDLEGDEKCLPYTNTVLCKDFNKTVFKSCADAVKTIEKGV